jgi:hypothetical protein
VGRSEKRLNLHGWLASLDMQQLMRVAETDLLFSGCVCVVASTRDSYPQILSETDSWDNFLRL